MKNASKTQEREFKHLSSITGFFVASLLVSNILSSAKLVDSQFSIFGFPLIFDGGLLLFPLCYIFGDILTEVYGFRKSRKVIWTGFICSFLLSGLVKILAILPGEQSWLEGGGQASYNFIFFGIYSNWIVMASLSAYLIGEFTNSILLAKLKVWTQKKLPSFRFILSTVISQIADTAIFLGVATLGGVFSKELFLSLFLSNYIVKILVEVVLLPISLRFSAWLKKQEGSDAFDNNISFNPFVFKKSANA